MRRSFTFLHKWRTQGKTLGTLVFVPLLSPAAPYSRVQNFFFEGSKKKTGTFQLGKVKGPPGPGDPLFPFSFFDRSAWKWRPRKWIPKSPSMVKYPPHHGLGKRDVTLSGCFHFAPPPFSPAPSCAKRLPRRRPPQFPQGKENCFSPPLFCSPSLSPLQDEL